MRSLAAKKYRDDEGLFVAEGTKCVRDTWDAFECRYLIATRAWYEQCGNASHYDKLVLAPKSQMARMSQFTTASDVLAVYEIPHREVNADEVRQGLNIVLDNIQDPGNLGTIIRLADWYGIRNIFASPTTVDVYNHKVVQATMGAIARVKVHYQDLEDLFDDYPEKLFAIRKDSPLIVGIGEGENFIASDIPAILSRTNQYYLLEENELAIITADAIKILGADRQPIEKNVFTATWDVSAAEKGGYDHFMLKEINEQPKVLADTILPRLKNGAKGIFAEEMPDISKIKRLHVVACGSALHAGMVGRHVIERIAKVPVMTEVASEFRYSSLLFEEGDAVVVISQSGETADTLAALRIAKKRGIPTIAIVNVVGSTIAREADIVLYTWAGPEIAVATTKAYTCQVAVMLMMALRFACERGTVSDAELEHYSELLRQIPDVVAEVIKNADLYKEMSQSYKECEDLFFIGRGYDAALCWEASIKLKEISYIHSEAYAAGELKHGTISLIEPGMPVVAIASGDQLFEKTVSNVKEVKARGAKVILLCKKGASVDSTIYDHLIEVPDVDEFIRPIAAIVPLQIFAYYTAVARGCDVDKPRNLAKSVTVE